MTKEDYLASYCANNDCRKDKNCDICMYNKGVRDLLEIQKLYGGLKIMEEIENIVESLTGDNNEC